MRADESTDVILLLGSQTLVWIPVATYLRDCGYTVIEGVSGADFHSVLDTGQRIHIVLVDVQLLGATGCFELAQSIRQTHPRIDVVLTCGITGTVKHAQTLCGEEPVRKPYQPRDLEVRIRLLLERRRASDYSEE